MTPQPGVWVNETASYLDVLPTGAPVAVDAMQEWYVQQVEGTVTEAEPQVGTG